MILLPIEIQKNCRFIIFELEHPPKSILCLPYTGILKMEWAWFNNELQNGETLKVFWKEGVVEVIGFDLRRLFSLFQKDEVFLMRKGTSDDLIIRTIGFIPYSHEIGF